MKEDVDKQIKKALKFIIANSENEKVINYCLDALEEICKEVIE